MPACLTSLRKVCYPTDYIAVAVTMDTGDIDDDDDNDDNDDDEFQFAQPRMISQGGREGRGIKQ